jgi:hypothetical protein
MKVSSCLFAFLALGAVSTNVASAEKPKTAVAAGTSPKQDSNTKAAAVTAPTTNSGSAAAHVDKQVIGKAALAVVAGNAPSISGTGLMRPGAGTGAGSVGGSAKVAGGAVSGNSVHLKRP